MVSETMCLCYLQKAHPSCFQKAKAYYGNFKDILYGYVFLTVFLLPSAIKLKNTEIEKATEP